MYFRYLTYTEWTTLYGGKRSGTAVEEDTTFKRLPYDHCCLCLQPFDDPYCDADGNIFELKAITDFVKKFKINPVTGKVCLKYYVLCIKYYCTTCSNGRQFLVQNNKKVCFQN